MTAFAFTVDDAQVRELLSRAPAKVQGRTRMLIEASAIDVQRQMIQNAPVAVTGALRQSITYTIDASGLSATIAPRVKYAVDVEEGTPPHHVSAAPGTSLAKWAQFKGANPYAIAAAIARRGTRAHPFVAPTFHVMKPKVEEAVANGIKALAQELSRGRI